MKMAESMLVEVVIVVVVVVVVAMVVMVVMEAEKATVDTEKMDTKKATLILKKIHCHRHTRLFSMCWSDLHCKYAKTVKLTQQANKCIEVR